MNDWTRADDTCMLQSWETPVSGYNPSDYGDVRTDRELAHGIHYGEGVKGFLYVNYGHNGIWITTLYIGDRMWMTDEPVFTWCMESYAARSSGKVLVAGLGLGLVVHFLVKDPEVSEILVVEKEQDVIGCIERLLPQDKRIKVVHDDFYQFLKDDAEQRDAVIWDLAVWDLLDGDEEPIGMDCIRRIGPLCFAQYGPDCKVFVHGLDRDEEGDRFVKEHKDEMQAILDESERWKNYIKERV